MFREVLRFCLEWMDGDPDLDQVWKSESLIPTAAKTKGSFIGAIFEDASNKKWLGKLGVEDKRFLSPETLAGPSVVSRGANR